jgi:hypothetical protein
LRTHFWLFPLQRDSGASAARNLIFLATGVRALAETRHVTPPFPM